MVSLTPVSFKMGNNSIGPHPNKMINSLVKIKESSHRSQWLTPTKT